jgi:maltose phosphorylase
LDDYNREVGEGLHITSMAGTWMSIVEGMAGIRLTDKGLTINPLIPNEWKSYQFNIFYQNQPLNILVNHNEVTITNNGNTALSTAIFQKDNSIAAGQKLTLAMN